MEPHELYQRIRDYLKTGRVPDVQHWHLQCRGHSWPSWSQVEADYVRHLLGECESALAEKLLDDVYEIAKEV